MSKFLSISILATTLLVHSTAISAQDTSESEVQRSDKNDSAQVEEIVVTGTRVSGRAIGSYVFTAGQEDIAAVAPINATELTNTIPAITTFGSAPLGQNGYSHFAPNIHGLGASLTNSTLTLINGLRMPGGGIQYGQPDPNIIPSSAIQRVEVLADGASSIYGSDAIAGVVNYITRSSYDGVALNSKLQYGDNYQAEDVNAIFGREWDTGGFYAAIQFTRQDQLKNASRDFLSRGDYRDIGGLSRLSYRCSPATIRTPASGTAVYLSPSEMNTVPGTDENAVCNLTGYGSAIPGINRQNALIQGHREFSDRLSVRASLNWNHYKGERDLGPGGLTNATVFGPNSGAGDQINPFFVAPTGDPSAPQELVTWVALRDDDQYGVSESENDTAYIVASTEYQINNQWEVGLSNAYGRSQHSVDTKNDFNSSRALLSLNGTVFTSGNTTASAIQGQNVVVLDLPLTQDNALDVWRPAGQNMTSQLILDQLYTSDSHVAHTNSFNQIKAELLGRPFKMPAGDVHVAAGLEWLWQEQRIEEVVRNTAGLSDYGEYGGARDTYSAYLEVALPLISEDMNLSMAQSLDVSLSARYDDIADNASTSNPKFGLDWQINDAMRVRANWATSFVAQPLNAVGFAEIGYRNGLGNAALTSGVISVPVSIYPEVTGVPGCATAVDSCNIGTTQTRGLRRHLRLGPDGKPQEGESWSIGVDLEPTWMRGFVANITLWNQKISNGATSPTPGQIVSNPNTQDRLTICPTGCTQAQISDFATLETGGTIGNIPSTVYYLIDRRYANIVNLTGQGIDYGLAYELQTSSMGNFKFSLIGSELTKMDQHFDGGPTFSVLNTAGFNLAFPSVKTRARFNLGWRQEPLRFDLFVNYIGEYRNWRGTTVTPVEHNSDGLPIGGGDKVDDQVTIDLHAEYKFERAAIFVDVKNVTDDDPPFISYNAGGSGLDGYGYNGFVSNPIGRIISVGFRSEF